VYCTPWDVHRLTGRKVQFLIVPCDNRFPANDVPVLSPPLVSLETQPFTRINNDPLDLVIRLISIDLIVTPWPMVFFKDPAHHPCPPKVSS
jgi:hypothetical protein